MVVKSAIVGLAVQELQHRNGVGRSKPLRFGHGRLLSVATPCSLIPRQTPVHRHSVPVGIASAHENAPVCSPRKTGARARERRDRRYAVGEHRGGSNVYNLGV